MSIYVVKKGDSLYSIGRRYGVNSADIAHLNELLSPDRLSVGQALVIPDGKRPAYSAEVNGFAYPDISSGALNEALGGLTYICPFSCRADAGGSIVPINDGRITEAAYAHAAAPLLCLTNIGANGGFCADIAHALFTDSAAQDSLMQNVLTLLRKNGYYGLCLFFCYVNQYDAEGYARFLRRFSDELHGRGYFFCAAAEPRTSDRGQGLPYTVFGECCDRVILLTYDMGWSYSPPQAVSPVDHIRRVLGCAVTRIAPDRILMGFSDYGYDRRLPWKQDEAAEMISNTAAQALAASVHAEIKFDKAAAAPYFNYTDPSGVRHELWFEDARSIAARLALVGEYGLSGISRYPLDHISRASFYLQSSEFVTEKII